MCTVTTFSKYLAYMVGGAEKSTYEVLKQKSNEGYDIELISFDAINTLGAKSKKVEFPKNWKLSYIKNMFLFKRFFYYEYVFNRSKLKKYFSKLDNNAILYTYAIYAPIAINSFKGKSKLFIRSETDLAINKNNLLVVENKGSLTNINLSDPITLKILKDNLDTPTTVAMRGKTAWVIQAQFAHLFGDEKDVPPGPFEIIGLQYKPSILTSLKKLLSFLN